MKLKIYSFIVIILVGNLFVILIFVRGKKIHPRTTFTQSEQNEDKDDQFIDNFTYYYNYDEFNSSRIPLAVSVCKESRNIMHLGNKLNDRTKWFRQIEQFRTMFGSLLIMKTFKVRQKVYVFVDTLQTQMDIVRAFEEWPPQLRRQINFEFRMIEVERLDLNRFSQWRPCAWVKMFLDKMLPEVDSVIYLDTDVVFLGPVDDFQEIFLKMDIKQAIALAPEVWYIHENDGRPHAGKYGLNTGVIGFNLTKIRDRLPKGLGFTLQNFHINYHKEPRHDQDVLNAFLKENPEMLMEISARYNFLPSSCMDFAPVCYDCQEKGILILHGADAIFYRLVDAKSMVRSHLTKVYKVFLEACKQMKIPVQQLLFELEDSLLAIDRKSSLYIYMCQKYENYNNELLLHLHKIVSLQLK